MRVGVGRETLRLTWSEMLTLYTREERRKSQASCWTSLAAEALAMLLRAMGHALGNPAPART